MIFYDLLCFFNFLAKINKKEKDKTTLQNHSRGYLTGFESSWGRISGLIVRGVK